MLFMCSLHPGVSFVGQTPLGRAPRASVGKSGEARSTLRWPRVIAAAALLAAVQVAQADSGEAQIDVRREGENYFVRASADVAADLPVAWSTLTDYERLPDFVPDIDRVRILVREGNRVIVEFRGTLRVLFFEWPVRMRLAIRPEPYGLVQAHSDPGPIDGKSPTLRNFSGRYTLTVLPVGGRAGVRIDYDAQFQLTEEVPQWIGMLIGRPLLRVALRWRFEAMLNEIARRQTARPSLQWSTS